MSDLQGKTVKILDGEYQGAAGYVEGHDTDGNALVSIAGIVNGVEVNTVVTVAPLQVEVLR